MGKAANLFLGISLLGLSLLGWCTHKKQEKINALETRIKNDSIADSENYLKLSNLLKDTTIFYSDSLEEILNLYKENLSENEKLNRKVSWLSKNIKKDNALEGFESKYNFLVKDYDSLKNERAKLFGLYQKEISKNQDLAGKLNNTETSYGTEYSQQSEKTKKNFNVKNQNLFRSWKFIPPRLFGISGEFVSFKDNDPEKMEAFAKYKTGRLVPLKRFDVSDKFGSFYLPYIDFPKGIITVYAVDKDGNKSKEYPVYISDDFVSKKKFE